MSKLDFTKATKQQLLTILSEDCSIDYKFKAAAELQRRKEKQTIKRYQQKATYTGKAYRVTV